MLPIVEANPKRVKPVSSPSLRAFAAKFPAQAAARIDPRDPASNHWALLIGINDYPGSSHDLIGSYQDARDLRTHLLSLGWRADHITLIGNRDAGRARIIQGIRWLASKTDQRSVVVFHYSGHELLSRTASDGDGERRDVAIWAADNRLVVDGTLGRELGRVRAAKMWIDMATCRAGGFDDAGMMKAGRVLTFSAPESELSYENPAWRHSIFGWYVIVEGMRGRLADGDGNGLVTVEEAFRYGKPLVTELTNGRQHPFIVDLLDGDLSLAPIAPAASPAPPTAEEPAPCGFPCVRR